MVTTTLITPDPPDSGDGGGGHGGPETIQIQNCETRDEWTQMVPDALMFDAESGSEKDVTTANLDYTLRSQVEVNAAAALWNEGE